MVHVEFFQNNHLFTNEWQTQVVQTDGINSIRAAYSQEGRKMSIFNVFFILEESGCRKDLSYSL